MLSSEFIICFAGDPIVRHFRQGDRRMQKCASCHFPVWELLFFGLCPFFSTFSSAPPNTSCKLLVWEPGFCKAV